jgi:oligopeptide transport system substrate-binding protein
VFRIAALVISAAMLLTGCTAAGGAATDVIRATGTEPASPLIPADTVELGGARVVDNIFAGLVAYQSDGTIVNDAAESIEASTDKKLFTVRLRGGLSFSDGEPVDADAFVKAWDWAADAANGAAWQGAFRDVVGFVADDPETPDIERGSLVEGGGLVVVDRTTFEIHLTGSQADFPQRLGQRAFFPLPATFFDDPAAFGEQPIGNGPYLIDGRWRHHDGIDLAVNPDYDGPRVAQNAGVTLDFDTDPETAYVDVLAGFLDVIDTLPASALPSYEDELAHNSLDVPGTTLTSIVIPPKLPHLTGVEGALRRSALSMAIDRVTIVADVFDDRRLIARDFTSPVVAGYSDVIPGAEVLTFSDDTAKERWAQADGLKKAGPWEGTLQIAYAADGPDAAAVSRVLTSISAVLGIDVEAVPYPTQADLDAAVAAGTMTMPWVRSQTAAYPGMLSYLSGYGSKSPGNVGHYTSKDFDAAMKAASLAADPDDIVDSYRDAQRILFTDLPAIPLWYSTRQAGAGQGLAGLALDWDGVPEYWAMTTNR